MGERKRETVKESEREREGEGEGSERERERRGEYENREGKEKSLKNRCAKTVCLYNECEHSVLSILDPRWSCTGQLAGKTQQMQLSRRPPRKSESHR